MTNYRQIFNTPYSIFGLFIIISLSLLIFIINKDIKKSCYNIGTHLILSGVITIILSLIINFGISIIIPNNYQILINVISKNLFKNLIFYSVICITTGIILIIIFYLIPKKIYKKSIKT